MKAWYTSKTILFNLVAAVVAFVATALPQLSPAMTPKTFAIFSLVVGVVNVVLRFVTSQAVSTR